MKDTTKAAPKMAVKKIPSAPILKHAAQLEKLQQKAALEASVVENIRTFLKQKATIERDCALALQKLITQHASRKDFVAYCDTLHGKGALKNNLSAITPGDSAETQTASENDKSFLTLAEFWTDCMDGLQKLQTLRISQSDEIIRLTSEELKIPKTARTRQVKQAMDTALDVHLEVNRVVDMITHSRKSYTEVESVIQEAKEKLRKFEQKAKKKGKPAAPPTKITEILEKETPKATAARNEYILSIVGSNSLLSRYYSHDLPYLMDMMNGNVYDTMRQTLASILSAELQIIPEAQQVYTQLSAENQNLSSRKDIESFISSHGIFKDPVQFSFEACTGDTVSSILLEGGTASTMEKCARKWAIRLLESQLAQKKLLEQIDYLEKQNVDVTYTTEEGKMAFETKQHSLKENLRNETNLQHTAHAILDTLQQGGVDVDTWMASAKIAIEEKITAASAGPEIITTLPLPPKHHSRSSSTIHSENVAENTVDQINASDSTSEVISVSETTSRARCIAMYDYSADRQDELSVSANEELFILDGSPDGEWLLVENSTGQQGYVPKTYMDANYKQDSGVVEFADENTYSTTARPDTSVYSLPSWDSETSPNVEGWDNGDNTDYAIQNAYSHDHEMSANRGEYLENGTSESPDNDSVHSEQRGDSGLTNRTSSVSSQQHNGSTAKETHLEAHIPQFNDDSFMHLHTDPVLGYCRALYDFNSDDPEDLAFQEGDVIKIVSRSHGDVDDGYWKGELHGRSGLFLSALTEEMADTDNSSDLGLSLSSTSSPLPLSQGPMDHSKFMSSVPDRTW